MSHPKPTTPGRIKRAQDLDNGWRKRIDNLPEKLDAVAACLEEDAGPLDQSVMAGSTPTDVIRRAAHLIRSARPDQTLEERAAWDAYAAAFAASERVDLDRDIWPSAECAARYADELLAERRKRFAGRASE